MKYKYFLISFYLLINRLLWKDKRLIRSANCHYSYVFHDSTLGIGIVFGSEDKFCGIRWHLKYLMVETSLPIKKNRIHNYIYIEVTWYNFVQVNYFWFESRYFRCQSTIAAMTGIFSWIQFFADWTKPIVLLSVFFAYLFWYLFWNSFGRKNVFKHEW